MFEENPEKRIERIRKLARSLYLRAKESGLPEDNPDKYWIKAEKIYNDKIEYFGWLAWQAIVKFRFEIIVAVAILSLVINIGLITTGILSSKAAADLDSRPYLSLYLESPERMVNKGETFFGNHVIIKSSGKIPAAKVATQCYVTTDVDKVNKFNSELLNKNLGSKGAEAFIVPITVEIEPAVQVVSGAADYFYFEAVISYEGLAKNKKYWTHLKKVFLVDKAKNTLTPVYSYGDWDRNQKFKPPKVSTSNQVANLIKSLKKSK